MKRNYRARPVGWKGESHRHYLAAKGISTKRYFKRSYPDDAEIQLARDELKALDILRKAREYANKEQAEEEKLILDMAYPEEILKSKLEKDFAFQNEEGDCTHENFNEVRLEGYGGVAADLPYDSKRSYDKKFRHCKDCGAIRDCRGGAWHEHEDEGFEKLQEKLDKAVDKL